MAFIQVKKVISKTDNLEAFIYLDNETGIFALKMCTPDKIVTEYRNEYLAALDDAMIFCLNIQEG